MRVVGMMVSTLVVVLVGMGLILVMMMFMWGHEMAFLVS